MTRRGWATTLWVLALLAVSLWCYNLGSIQYTLIVPPSEPIICDEVQEHEDGAVVCEIFLREGTRDRVIKNGVTKEDRI